MDHYAGIDVSLATSSVCILDATGRIVREAKVASEPEALVAFLAGCGHRLAASAWRRGRCRSGSTRGWSRRDCRRSSWRPGT
jgi:hypothetical protein